MRGWVAGCWMNPVPTLREGEVSAFEFADGELLPQAVGVGRRHELHAAHGGEDRDLFRPQAREDQLQLRMGATNNLVKNPKTSEIMLNN